MMIAPGEARSGARSDRSAAGRGNVLAGGRFRRVCIVLKENQIEDER